MTAWLPTIINSVLLGLVAWFGKRELDSTKKAAEKAEAAAKRADERLADMRVVDAEHTAGINELRTMISNLQASYESVKRETDKSSVAVQQRLDQMEREIEEFRVVIEQLAGE